MLMRYRLFALMLAAFVIACATHDVGDASSDAPLDGAAGPCAHWVDGVCETDAYAQPTMVDAQSAPSEPVVVQTWPSDAGRDGGRGRKVGSIIPVGGPPTGAAGGDLGTTYPNPTVVALTGSGNTTTVRGTSQALNWSAGNITLQENATTLAQLGQAATDYIALGATPVAGTGFVRGPKSATYIAGRNAGNSADIAMVALNGFDQILCGDNNTVSFVYNVKAGTGNGYYWQQNGTTIADLNSSTANVFTWAPGATAPGLAQAAQTSNALPPSITVTPSAPWASATLGNRVPGSFVVNVAAPTNSGTVEGGLYLQRGGVNQWLFSSFPGAPGVAVLYGGSTAVGAPTAANYSFAADNGPTTYFNADAGGTVRFRIASAVAMGAYNANGLQLFSETFALGGGTGILGVANASVLPTSNCSTGPCAYGVASKVTAKGIVATTTMSASLSTAGNLTVIDQDPVGVYECDSVASGGGTCTIDFTLAANEEWLLEADTMGVTTNAAFRDYDECVVTSDGTTARFAAAVAGSANPQVSATTKSQRAVVSDTAFNSGTGSPSTTAWSVTASKARLTITNSSATQANNFLARVRKTRIK